jgi:predicted ribosome quality control (RQC) complex YloA/Tae2 family protein
MNDKLFQDNLDLHKGWDKIIKILIKRMEELENKIEKLEREKNES